MAIYPRGNHLPNPLRVPCQRENVLNIERRRFRSSGGKQPTTIGLFHEDFQFLEFDNNPPLNPSVDAVDCRLIITLLGDPMMFYMRAGIK